MEVGYPGHLVAAVFVPIVLVGPSIAETNCTKRTRLKSVIKYAVS